MVVISAGRFRMGDIQGDGDDDEQQCVESAGDFVLRGGAWDYYATGARSADRDDFVPTYRSNDCGFRPARIK
jgi:formylglycine-generating enzyme required for sulfatase activity